MKNFNVTGPCVPKKHYMVDISEKLAEIKKLVDNGSYFTINKARQYGKTTTLFELRKVLQNEYEVYFVSFEGFGDSAYQDESSFCTAFVELFDTTVSVKTIRELNHFITEFCKDKKIVLLIDEVDRASNFRVFSDFLALLRKKFIAQAGEYDTTFYSVVLAGVTDIKNIKLKMVADGNYVPKPTETKTVNSPWNIAVDFEVDMSFDSKDISTMLIDYQNEQKIEFNISEISEEIYTYTSGYPYLVSRICKHIDEKLDRDWSVVGVEKAVKILVTEKNTLFDDLFKNLENDKSLFDLIYAILILGEERKYSIDVSTTNFGLTYGIIRNENNKIKISNKIFEIRICEFFISKDESVTKKSNVLKYDIVKNNRFDMKLCLEKFAEYYEEIYSEKELTFLEKHGRLLFLSYLRPLINGEGFFHIESQFTDLRRMDLVIDFNSQQFVIELKIWDGDAKHQEAYKQLSSYLEKKNLKTGYLLTFNFNKNKEKVKKISTEIYGDYEIFDVIV
ncbi:MAG: hypothetical protein LBM93_06485 [Oscillospiraceae bacterium]|jgi:hypothetical protein|nr:hypothetical protein [Oscillospiraceae bacterium]